jgi:hypothetical protein
MSTIAVLPGPGDIVKIRASGLGEIFDCARRWKGRTIDGDKGQTHGRSHLGSSVHYGTAWYDNERTLDGGCPDTETAIDKFLEFFRAEDHVMWSDIPKQKAEQIGIQLTSKYCLEISAQYEWIKVEATCEPIEITMPNGIIFELTGHVDRVYTRDGKYGVADFKSGGRVIAADGSLAVDKHGLQLACYELLEIMAAEATGHKMELPALIVGFSTSGDLDILTEEVPNPRELLFGDGDYMGYLMGAAAIIEHQLYLGNTKSQLCGPRYCNSFDKCEYIKKGK